MEKNNLKLFFIKLISITISIIIILNVIFNLLLAERFEKIDNILSLDKSKFRSELRNKIRNEITDFDSVSKFDYLSKIKNQDSNVSSFITIQEGCDKFCHFCVVPYTRGPEYSRPFYQILN